MHASAANQLDPDGAPVTTALGVLGMPGRTAWFGLTEAGRPHAGEVVVVSGAAGAVGSLVVQFASGRRAVLGIAGGAANAPGYGVRSARTGPSTTALRRCRYAGRRCHRVAAASTSTSTTWAAW